MNKTMSLCLHALIIIPWIFLSACSTQLPSEKADRATCPLTVEMIEEAQNAWCKGLVSIGEAPLYERRPRDVAAEMIDDLYNYAVVPVLFKPTLTHGSQTFRPSREGALAYFVGGDSNFPNDSGFALKPWIDARIINHTVFTNGDVALAQGILILVDPDGNEIKVDKSFGYFRDKDGKLRIVLHHSSLPFSP